MRGAPLMLLVLAACGRLGFPGESGSPPGLDAAAAPPPDARPTPPTDYAARFRFDENTGTRALSDGAQLVGTLGAGVGWAPGHHGSAIAFDPASTGAVDVGDAAALRQTGSMTLSVWYYLVATPGACATLAIHGGPNGSGANGNALYGLSLGGGSALWYQEAGAQIGTTTAVTLPATATALRVWHHVAAVRAATAVDASTLVIYVDGVAAPAVAIGLPTGGTAGTLRLGRDVEDGGACSTPIPAFLDELTLYPRALTPDEIALLGAGDPPVP